MRKNTKFFLLIAILILYKLITFTFGIENTKIFLFLINPIFYLSIFLLARKILSKPFERKKERKEKSKTTIIFTFLYLIIFFLLGLVLTFENTPYSLKILSIIKNLYSFISVIVFQELTRSLMVNVASKKKICYA